MNNKKSLYFENDNNYNREQKVVMIDGSHDSKRLDIVLASLYPSVSRSRIQNWIITGAVSLDGLTAKSSTRVRFGQKLKINPPIISDNSEWEPEHISLNIIHEDSSILVLNKQSGLVVHPGAGNPNGTLLNGLIYYLPSLKKLPRAGIVHRLDRDTSGLLVIAKTIEAHKSLVDQLQQRKAKREYIAVSWGKLTKKLKIQKSLARNQFNRQKFSVSDARYAKESQTDAEPISYGNIENNPVSLIKCNLKSGRTHQIRVHLEHVNHPIIGDRTYKKGSPKFNTTIIQRQALHAINLSFIHPSSDQTVQFESLIPDDISRLINFAGLKW